MGFFLTLVQYLIQILILIIIVSSVISWFDPRRGHPVSRFFWYLSEPIVGPIRSLIPSFAGLDFSPFVAFILLYMLKVIIAR